MSAVEFGAHELKTLVVSPTEGPVSELSNLDFRGTLI